MRLAQRYREWSRFQPPDTRGCNSKGSKDRGVAAPALRLLALMFAEDEEVLGDGREKKRGLLVSAHPLVQAEQISRSIVEVQLVSSVGGRWGCS